MVSGISSWTLVLVAAGMLVLPALLALAVHAIFGWRYRRAVGIGMSGQGVAELRAVAAALPSQAEVPGRPPLVLLETHAPAPPIPLAEELRHKARRAAAHVRWAFAAAGILQMATTAALTYAALIGTAFAEVYPPMLTAFVTTAPGTVVLALFALRAAHWRAALIVAWLAVAVVIFRAGPDRILANGPNVVMDYVRISIRDALLPLLPLSLLLVRRLRTLLIALAALGIYVLVGTAVFMILYGGNLADLDLSRIRIEDAWLAAVNVCLGLALVVWILRRRQGPESTVALFAVVVAVTWAVHRWVLPDSRLSLAVLGTAANALQWYALWLILRLLVRLQEQRILPAEVLHWYVCWLFLALLAGQNFTVLLSEANTDLLVAAERGHVRGVAPFAANLLVLHVALHQLRRRSSGAVPPRLLLLRVFGSAAKRVRLLDLFAETLRRAVRVDYIAGTDLAQRHVGALALEAFVRGRLHTLFLSSRAEADSCIGALRDRRDLELRYPLNELYCRSHAWQYAVERLASRADAVCMDLRGFSQRNLGCVFELGVLVQSVALRKVLLLADATTDVHALAAILQTAWRHAPQGGANDRLAQPAIRIVAVRRWAAAERELLESWLFVTVVGGTPTTDLPADARIVASDGASGHKRQ